MAMVGKLSDLPKISECTMTGNVKSQRKSDLKTALETSGTDVPEKSVPP